MNKHLIVYYSFTKQTESLALEIASQVNGDIRELIPEAPISFDYNTAAKEARSQIERGYCPALLSGNEPMGNYDTIFIGSPNWFKSIAPPVLSFLRAHDFYKKTVVPFCTHGGGGFGEVENKIKEECKNANFLKGIATNGFSTEDISSWLNEIGILI